MRVLLHGDSGGLTFKLEDVSELGPDKQQPLLNPFLQKVTSQTPAENPVITATCLAGPCVPRFSRPPPPPPSVWLVEPGTGGRVLPRAPTRQDCHLPESWNPLSPLSEGAAGGAQAFVLTPGGPGGSWAWVQRASSPHSGSWSPEGICVGTRQFLWHKGEAFATPSLCGQFHRAMSTHPRGWGFAPTNSPIGLLAA